MKITARWKKFKDVAGLLCKKGLSVKFGGVVVYKMYIRNAMNYGAENWPTKVNNIMRMEFT